MSGGVNLLVNQRTQSVNNGARTPIRDALLSSTRLRAACHGRRASSGALKAAGRRHGRGRPADGIAEASQEKHQHLHAKRW